MTQNPPRTVSYTRHQGSDAPDRWMLVLHGILGSRSNWRAIVRRVLQDRPRWGAITVDLRNHGESQGFSAPHTLPAVAADLIALGGALDLTFDAVIGHSYGGKVALQHAADTHGAARAVIVVDATPSARHDARGSEVVLRVLDALESTAGTFDSREAFAAAMAEREIPREIAAWLAMNLTPAHGRFALRLNLPDIRAMLRDYFATDLWSVVEDPPGRSVVHLIVAGRSPVFSPEDIAHAAAAARARPDAVKVHTLPNATHWVHADSPDALRAVLLGALDDAAG